MPDTIAQLNDALAGRYRVERVLGRGGSATVYQATDIRHGRPVAIKVLEHEIAAAIGPDRFMREIQVTANLRHQNLLALYDSGRAVAGSAGAGVEFLYYVMPLIDGGSLQERLSAERQLPVDEALQIIHEVAAGLALAHAGGIIHRDIKPGNILLDRGHALLSDFGIAWTIGSDRMTRTGVNVGTAAYMSPEQMTGDPLDARSDEYSLACVLYEMLTGEPPHTGSTNQAILAKRVLQPVPDVRTLRDTVPDHVAEAIRRALSRSPADRFGGVAAFDAALAGRSSPGVRAFVSARRTLPRIAALVVTGAIAIGIAGVVYRVRSPARGDARRIAVVAPLGYSGDEPDAALILGAYNTLLTKLGEAGVTVVGGTETMLRYAAAHATVPEIAEQLGVDAVLEPSVAWDGDSVAIAVRLIEGRDETTVLSKELRGSASDVVSVSHEIASLLVPYAGSPAGVAVATTARTVNAEAYRATSQGSFYMKNLTAADLQRAVEYFDLALAADSEYAPAYAGVAWTWIARQQMGFDPPQEATPIAVRAAHRAVALDSMLPEAHRAVAAADGWAAWNWDVAETEYRKALALNPSYGDARADLSHLLLVLGRVDEAIAQADSAVASDPLNLRYQVFQATVYMGAGRYDEAATQLERVLESIPNHPVALNVLAGINQVKGNEAKAIRYFVADLRAEELGAVADVFEATVEASGFQQAMLAAGDSLAAMDAVTRQAPVMIAGLYVLGGDSPDALSWLERALALRDPNLPYIAHVPRFRSLRAEPRFQAILRALGLPLPDATPAKVSDRGTRPGSVFRAGRRGSGVRTLSFIEFAERLRDGSVVGAGAGLSTRP